MMEEAGPPMYWFEDETYFMPQQYLLHLGCHMGAAMQTLDTDPNLDERGSREEIYQQLMTLREEIYNLCKQIAYRDDIEFHEDNMVDPWNPDKP